MKKLLGLLLGGFFLIGAAPQPSPQSICELEADFPLPEEVRSYFKDEDLISGDSEFLQVGSAVWVNRPGNPYHDGWRAYNRSNRGLAGLGSLYPESVLSIEALRGERVLDIAMGGGKLVTNLRAAGIEAYGLDVALSSLQRPFIFKIFEDKVGPNGLWLSPEEGRGHFVQADAMRTGLAPNQFQRIFSTHGPLQYDEDNPEYMRMLLVEVRRLLTVGGRFHAAPFYEGESEARLRAWVDTVDGLKLEGLPESAPGEPDFRFRYTDIVRVK